MNQEYRDKSAESRKLIWVFLCFYVIVVLRNAWMGDDAFITLRVVDNFINGYGLCWNVGERVQAYTHPLWLLVITPLYALTGEAYFTVIILSILMSAAAVAVFAFKIARSVAVACLGIGILSLSDAFIDYSTSGLESPLTFLLLAVFLAIYFDDKPGLKHFVWLSFIASMAALTRLDIIIIYLPMLAYAFREVRGWNAVKGLVIGFTPLMAWLAFSLIYYGFPFPNTAYAKLDTGISSALLMKQGFGYIINSLNVDPLTMLTILVFIVTAFTSRRWKPVWPALGILLTFVYIIRIGGCFMSGRFLAAPFLVSVLTLAYLFRDLNSRYIIGAGTVFIALGMASPYSPLYSRASDVDSPLPMNNYIVDERAWYSPSSGLLNYRRESEIWPSIDWAYAGLEARESEEKIMVHNAIGHLGYRSGPGLHIIDLNGLADPLLSRLPIRESNYRKPGHYLRTIPLGYEQSIREDRNLIRDSKIARFYDIIRLLTRGPIWNLRRFKEIIKMNLGWYDVLVEDYARPQMQSYFLSDLSTPRPEGAYWCDPGSIVLDSLGIKVDLGGVYHARQFEFCRDNNDDYLIKLYLDDDLVDSIMAPQNPIPGGGLSKSMITVPETAASTGYNTLKIYPVGPDHLNSIGHIIF